MSAHEARPAAAYEVEPKNRFFEATRAIVEYEICPANTVTFLTEVDLTAVERVRARAPDGPRPSYTAFVVKAVALALRAFPYANRRVLRRPWLPLTGARLQRFARCDVAVAVERDLPGAESTAFIDILRDADGLSLPEITATLKNLAICDEATNVQWREFSTLIRRCPGWLSAFLIRLPCFVPGLWIRYRGGAALISSPAKYGVDVVAATWSHPLGVSFGLVKSRPVVRGETVVACPTFTLTLNFDRRVMAGAQGARFFRRVVELLERADAELAGPAPAATSPRPVARAMAPDVLPQVVSPSPAC